MSLCIGFIRDLPARPLKQSWYVSDSVSAAQIVLRRALLKISKYFAYLTTARERVCKSINSAVSREPPPKMCSLLRQETSNVVVKFSSHF